MSIHFDSMKGRNKKKCILDDWNKEKNKSEVMI